MCLGFGLLGIILIGVLDLKTNASSSHFFTLYIAFVFRFLFFSLKKSFFFMLSPFGNNGISHYALPFLMSCSSGPLS